MRLSAKRLPPPGVAPTFTK